MIRNRKIILFFIVFLEKLKLDTPLKLIDSVAELRDTLLRAAPSMILLLSSFSSSVNVRPGAAFVSDSVTYRFRLWWLSVFFKLHVDGCDHVFVMFGLYESIDSVPWKDGKILNQNMNVYSLLLCNVCNINLDMEKE
jgi:hypothetical protein